MYRLVQLQKQGGSSVVVLPKRALDAADFADVPLRPRVVRGKLSLAPDPLLLEISKVLGPYRGRIRTALVYGSYARGDWDPDKSDIDLFIVAEAGVEASVAHKLHDFLPKRAVLVSAQFFSPQQVKAMSGSRYLAEVLRTGVPLWTK